MKLQLVKINSHLKAVKIWRGEAAKNFFFNHMGYDFDFLGAIDGSAKNFDKVFLLLLIQLRMNSE